MTALLLAIQLAALTPACPSVQPSPAFVCVNGGWLPPGHPLIPAVIAPEPPPTPGTVRFRVGRRYLRQTSPDPYTAGQATDLFIAGAGQLPDGTPVLFASCLAVGDSCFTVGYVRVILAHATASDWTEMPLP